MRESELLAHIYNRSKALPGSFAEVVVGPGDDCAVLRSVSGDLTLLSVDQLIEGRHFDPGTPPDRIADKAFARSISDLAAMGGEPTAALAAAALPDSFRDADTLFDAMHRVAADFACPLVGGDIARTTGPLSLTVTVVGSPHTERGPVLRSDARVGDAVFVTGRLGGSLASGRHLSFSPRLAEGGWLCDTLGDRLGAMIDLSDGLGRDAGRIALASGVAIELDASLIPRHPDVTDAQAAVSDGEDYELCFTARGDVPRRCPQTGTAVTRVGRVVAGSGCTLRLDSGDVLDASELGWEHG